MPENASRRKTLIKEYEVVKADVHFCFDNKESFKDVIDYCISADSAVLKSLQYLFVMVRT